MGGAQTKKNEFEIALETKGKTGFAELVMKTVSMPEELEKLKGKDFDYECLVFEGGGVKGCAYGGALAPLYELGMVSKFKRLAGTSAGAFMALQVLLEVSMEDLIIENVIPSFKEFYDASNYKAVVNILYSYGWHSGSNVTKKIEDLLEKKLKVRKLTFQQLYEKTGKELCVVITNLNMKCVKYCHPKTTPGMDVAEAVRTSMSLPMLYMPNAKKDKDMMLYFVDGALLDNYPLRVFDGWFLSMKPEDAFIEKMHDDPRTQFAELNPKTLGMVVFSYGEQQESSGIYLKRLGDPILHRPESPMAIERNHTLDIKQEKYVGRETINSAAREVIKFMADEVKAQNLGTEMTLAQFENAVEKARQDPGVSVHLETLFGSKDGLKPLEVTFEMADVSKNDKLSLVECLEYLQRRGVYLRYNLKPSYPTKIDSLTAFISSMMEVMMVYISHLSTKPEDTERTVGVYTDYVGVADFDMDFLDKVYLLRQGYRSTVAFLKEKAGIAEPAAAALAATVEPEVAAAADEEAAAPAE